MRLELGEVVVAGGSFLGLLGFEDYDSACFISDGKIVARVVEGEGIDDIFFKYFLIGAFIAEELGELVVGGFGRS